MASLKKTPSCNLLSKSQAKISKEPALKTTILVQPRPNPTQSSVQRSSSKDATATAALKKSYSFMKSTACQKSVDQKPPSKRSLSNQSSTSKYSRSVTPNITRPKTPTTAGPLPVFKNPFSTLTASKLETVEPAILTRSIQKQAYILNQLEVPSPSKPILS